MEKFIITTTPSIEGHPIKAYLGAINVNVVIGNNFFSEFAASFTDVFGGNSGIYQRKMDAMYESAQKELEKKAKRMGGNAVVGFKTDFDEISGKGVSMFMVNAVGTACKAKQITSEKAASNSILLDEEDLENAVQKYKIIQDIKNKKSARISEDTIDYLVDHPTKEIVDELLDYYYVVKVSVGGGYAAGGVYVADEAPKRVASNIKFINQYIGLVMDEEVLDKVYSMYAKNNTYI